MARILQRLALLGLVLAGPVLSLPHDASNVEREAVAGLPAADMIAREVLLGRASTVFITSTVTTVAPGAASSSASSTATSSVPASTNAVTTSSAAPQTTSAPARTTTGAATSANAGMASTGSPSATPEASSGGGGLSGGAIAGIVVGVVAAVVIVAILGFCLAKRRKNARREAATGTRADQGHDPTTAAPMKEVAGAPYAGPSGQDNAPYTSIASGYRPNPQYVSELSAEESAHRQTQAGYAQPQNRYPADTGFPSMAERNELPAH